MEQSQPADSTPATEVQPAPMAAAPAAPRGLTQARKERGTHTLRNGAVVEFREPIVDDVFTAQRIASEGGEASTFLTNVALVAAVSTVDGERFTFEDWRRVPAAEFGAVLEKVMGND